MKNDFISSVSHELRTPLTAIKGWAETLMDDSVDRETTKKGIGVIIKESERLSRHGGGAARLQPPAKRKLAEPDQAGPGGRIKRCMSYFHRAPSRFAWTTMSRWTSCPSWAMPNRLDRCFVDVLDNALIADAGDTSPLWCAAEQRCHHHPASASRLPTCLKSRPAFTRQMRPTTAAVGAGCRR